MSELKKNPPRTAISKEPSAKNVVKKGGKDDDADDPIA